MKNAEGYHPGPVTSATADAAPIIHRLITNLSHNLKSADEACSIFRIEELTKPLEYYLIHGCLIQNGQRKPVD